MNYLLYLAVATPGLELAFSEYAGSQLAGQMEVQCVKMYFNAATGGQPGREAYDRVCKRSARGAQVSTTIATR